MFVMLLTKKSEILLYVEAHTWDDNVVVVEWLMSQLNANDGKSPLEENIKTLQKDAISQQVSQSYYEVVDVLDRKFYQCRA